MSWRGDPARMRAVVEWRWAHPFANVTETAEATGVSRRTLTRWRTEDNEVWQEVNRDAAAVHVADLAPAATAALLSAWKAGRAEREAVEYLRSVALLAPQTSNVNIHEADAGEIRDRLIRRILGQRHPDDAETG